MSINMTTIESPKSLLDDFEQFISLRQIAGYRESLNDDIYRARRKEADREIKEARVLLMDQLGGDTKENWSMIDSFESAINAYHSIDADASYMQGLRDGFKLLRLLDVA